MAHEGINKFIDRIAHMYREEPDAFQQFTLLEVLMHYEDTVLKIGKFKCQKSYLKETINDLNPGYYAGYYGKRVKSIPDPPAPPKDRLLPMMMKMKENGHEKCSD